MDDVIGPVPAASVSRPGPSVHVSSRPRRKKAWAACWPAWPWRSNQVVAAAARGRWPRHAWVADHDVVAVGAAQVISTRSEVRTRSGCRGWRRMRMGLPSALAPAPPALPRARAARPRARPRPPPRRRLFGGRSAPVLPGDEWRCGSFRHAVGSGGCIVGAGHYHMRVGAAVLVLADLPASAP